MNTESYPMNNVVAPGDHDALCGRGGHTIHWSGNIKFRALVEQHRDRYHSASRVEKGKVVAEVVQMWRQMTPPGRFLTLTEPKLGDASPWHDIGDKSAQKKTAKRLREGHSSNGIITASASSSAVVSDEDSVGSGSARNNNKRCIRRVSGDSTMEKSAKRVRLSSSSEAVPRESFVQLPTMSMALFGEAQEVSEVSGEDFPCAPTAWEPVSVNDLEQDLDLDCLFDDIKPESDMPPLPTTTTALPAAAPEVATTTALDCSTMDNHNNNNNSFVATQAWPATISSSTGFGGSAALKEIADSIPSAACLIELVIFD